jgi:hypothetical protein
VIRWLVLIGAVASGSVGLPPKPLAPSKPLATAPIEYYDGACSHCHGPYGSAYTDAFYTHTDLVQLKATLKRMADGPGQSPIDGIDLDAQVAFHQAMIVKLPFLAWTGQDGLVLTGEVTRKSTVTATAGSANLPVKVQGSHWSLQLASASDLAGLSLTATLGKASVTCRPSTRPFSVPKVWPPKRT